jgi:Bacterial PH domain
MIVAVEFPSNVRFARLVLPADESFAVYAVQRLDGERAMQTMRELRALHAATRQT